MNSGLTYGEEQDLKHMAEVDRYTPADGLLSEMEGEKESDQDNQPLIMVEALNLYNQLKDMAVPLDAIIREMIKDFHITRK